MGKLPNRCGRNGRGRTRESGDDFDDDGGRSRRLLGADGDLLGHLRLGRKLLLLLLGHSSGLARKGNSGDLDEVLG